MGCNDNFTAKYKARYSKHNITYFNLDSFQAIVTMPTDRVKVNFIFVFEIIEFSSTKYNKKLLGELIKELIVAIKLNQKELKSEELSQS